MRKVLNVETVIISSTCNIDDMPAVQIFKMSVILFIDNVTLVLYFRVGQLYAHTHLILEIMGNKIIR